MSTKAPKRPYYGPPGTPRIVERTYAYGDGNSATLYVVQQLEGYCPERWRDIEGCETLEESQEILWNLVIGTKDTVIQIGAKK